MRNAAPLGKESGVLVNRLAAGRQHERYRESARTRLMESMTWNGS